MAARCRTGGKEQQDKTLDNVEVWQISEASTEALQALCERTMQLQLNVMDGEWTLIGNHAQAVIEWQQLK